MPATELPRFIVWIDAVGGFLVCPASVVRLGQAVPGSDVDVPLMADVSRRHLTIRRDAEGYVADPQRPTARNGCPLSAPTALADGDRLALGPVLLGFRRPHALSATARLEFASVHRTQPACDAVLLLADSCVLGPKPSSHIVCPGWPREVLLLRDRTGLACAISGTFEVDGRPAQGRSPLRPDSRVEAEDLRFALEPLA